MEYLMTYGWAILIIAVVLGALFQLGVFNSSSFSPRAPPGACQVFRPSGPGTTTNINLMGVCTGQLPQYVAQFNGVSSYVDAGNSATLFPTTTLSLSAWINPPDVVSDAVLLSSRGGVNINSGSSLELYNNLLYFNVYAGGSWRQVTESIAANTWSHVTGTFDGSYLRIYVNSVAGTPLAYSGTITQSSEKFAIGRDGAFNGHYYGGRLSNAQLYNTSLSANQIQALYLEGMGGAPMKLQNLVGWWPLNGNSNDYSGNNNNGVPTATTFTSQYGK